MKKEFKSNLRKCVKEILSGPCAVNNGRRERGGERKEVPIKRMVKRGDLPLGKVLQF